MNRNLVYLTLVSASVFLAQSAHADVLVESPTAGANVTSPIMLQAFASTCENLATTAMAYSIDDEKDNMFKGATQIIEPVQLTQSAHVIHAKAWNTKGELCETNTSVTVVESIIPSNATVVTNIEDKSNWVTVHDLGTPGWSKGNTTLVSPPYPTNDPNKHSRQFAMTYGDDGGQRASDSFGDDPNATHFVYDLYVYYPSSTTMSDVQNLELDMNQILTNHSLLMIYGTQCASGSKTWEYTLNASKQWNPSNIPCDPMTWSTDKWHHVTIASHRDTSGTVTYDSITFDGVMTDFYQASGNSEFQVKPWGEVLLINFQLDGATEGGSITNYADRITVSRW